MAALLGAFRATRSGGRLPPTLTHMLTLAEVLDDAAALAEFSGVQVISVTSRGASGQTPLHWMAALGDVAGIDVLLVAGADIDAADFQGTTPLHEAVSSRQHAAVRTLLQRGARADIQNSTGRTPCDVAKAEGYAPVLKAFNDAD